MCGNTPLEELLGRTLAWDHKSNPVPRVHVTVEETEGRESRQGRFGLKNTSQSHTLHLP